MMLHGRSAHTETVRDCFDWKVGTDKQYNFK